MAAEVRARSGSGLREGGDAELGGGIRDKRERFQGLIGRDRALREGVGGAVIGLPGGELAGLRLNETEVCALCEGARPHSRIPRPRWNPQDWPDRARARSSGGGGKDLPVGGHALVAELDPVFADGVAENQRAALDGDGVVEPAGDARLHGQGEFDAVAGAPGALDAGEI